MIKSSTSLAIHYRHCCQIFSSPISPKANGLHCLISLIPFYVYACSFCVFIFYVSCAFSRASHSFGILRRTMPLILLIVILCMKPRLPNLNPFLLPLHHTIMNLFLLVSLSCVQQ